MNRGDARAWLFHKFGLTPPGEQRAMSDDRPIALTDVGRKVCAEIEAAYARRAEALRRLFGIGDAQ